MRKKHLEKLFNKINLHLFDDELPTPEFYIFNDDCDLFPFVIDGVIIPEGEHYIIGIHEDCQTIFDTMVHEMIHLWQMENHKHANHSGWFITWCNKAYEEFYRK